MTARFTVPSRFESLPAAPWGPAVRRPLHHPGEGDTIATAEFFVPEYYEPNYAYPVLGWVTTHNEHPLELRRVVPQITSRNCVGVRLLSPADARGECRADEWLPAASLEEFSRHVDEMIGDLRAGLNLHPERVFLAGFGTSGARALQLLLHRPEHFAGAAVLSASIPAGLELPADRTLEGRRILLARGSRDRTVCEVRLAECARRLEQFGAQVETATFDASHHLSRAMLLHVDRWMMDAVCCADRG